MSGREQTRLGEGCLSRGVLDITCEKSLRFLYLPNQYKDIQPFETMSRRCCCCCKKKKFFSSCLPFTAISFNAARRGTLRSCSLLLLHECGHSLHAILCPRQRQGSIETAGGSGICLHHSCLRRSSTLCIVSKDF